VFEASPQPAKDSLEVEFQRVARRVRWRLALRRVLTFTALGSSAGVLAAGAAWWWRAGELRPFAALLALVGAAAGASIARRARWSDRDVALYLDEKLGSKQQLVTALELRGTPEAAARHVQQAAARALATAELEKAPALRGPKIWDSTQLGVPLGAVLLVWINLLALPPAPKLPVEPGAERIQLGNVKGLERVEALSNAKAQSPEDEAKLEALAEQAKRLRAELAQGMEKREALSRMAKLRDAISELRSEFGNPQNRPGLEAAIGTLAERPEMRKAARALGDGDLTAFDQEMQRLANQAEKTAREQAKQTLEEAARAAREKGSKELARALEAEKRAFEKREAEAEALRQLAEALGDGLDAEALDDLKEFGSSGDPEAGRRLAEAMGKALSKLSAEERKRLAEQLKKHLEGQTGGAAKPMSPEELQELARRLASPEGQKELEQRLRELAEGSPSDPAERDGALGEAERGADEAQRGLGGVPLPMQGGTQGPPSRQSGGADKGKQSGASSGTETGQGDHRGKTDAVQAPELRSKANTVRNPNGPMHAATLGRAPARTGDTANQRGTGSLGTVAPTEIGAVEQSEVPEEYREHVGRYFEP
jgi:hypothetical protein